MNETVMTYFNAEKSAAVMLMIAAASGFVVAAALMPVRWGLRPLAITLAVFAAIELAIGVGLYLRTDPQVRDLLARMNAGDARVYDDELARMQRVQRNFVAIEYAEVVFLVLSALAAVALKRQPVVVGIALGIVVNAAFLLGFDLVADRRGAIYLFAIERQAERPPTTR